MEQWRAEGGNEGGSILGGGSGKRVSRRHVREGKNAGQVKLCSIRH